MDLTYVLWAALTIAVSIISKLAFDKMDRQEKRIEKIECNSEGIVKNYTNRFDMIKDTINEQNLAGIDRDNKNKEELKALITELKEIILKNH